MRYLVLSDVHANASALESVLEDARDAWDAALLLGDLVGYGGSPNEVVDRVRSLPIAAAVRGNHDKVGAGLEDGRNFNPAARAAALWANESLSPDNLEWLRALPRGPVVADSGVVLCHGSPADEDAYVFSPRDVLDALQAHPGRLILFGHTHLPMALRLDELGRLADRSARPGQALALGHEAHRWLLNPGSVGQPRDGNARASYALLEPETGRWELRRAEYDVAASQAAILAAGLPSFLADRLALGA